MYEPILRVGAIFCCLGMGAWPLMQRCGCCCASAVQIADRIDEEQRCDCCRAHDESAPAPDPSKCRCPLASQTFEAVPAFVIKTVGDDLSAVESVFSSPFQASRPGDSALWEVVENLRPPRVPRHVLFCTFLE